MLHPHYTTTTLPLLPGSSDVIIIVAFFELFSLSFSSLNYHSFIGVSSSCPASSKLLIGQKIGANMCNNKSSSTICRQRKASKSADSCTKPAARKTRTKARKPKYLSLKLGLISPHKRTPKKPTKKMALNNKKKRLNLFPIHTENLVPQGSSCKEEEDMHDHDDDDDKDGGQVPDHDDHVAFLFESATDDTSTSLHGLLDSTTTTATTTTTTSEEGPISPSIMYIRGGNGHGSSQLERLRTAMRRKERDASEDRWVSYWEVVKKEQEEVTSSSCFASVNLFAGDVKGLVGLKLDYQGVLNAWSDKAPLYVESEAPQTVPVLPDVSNVLADGNLWTVPELGSLQMEDKEGLKLGHREASLRRYKEKRHNRLFSKQIRYEVRKINAEKRPRLKGRFVKRSGKE